MLKNHLIPAAIFILLLLLGGVGCSANQISPVAYVTVTPSIETSIETVASSNLPDNMAVIYVADFLTPLPARETEGQGDNPPTGAPASRPTDTPAYQPTGAPASQPTDAPTRQPTSAPTRQPTSAPTRQPTGATGAIVSIQSVQFANCAEKQSSELSISGANNLQGFAFKLRFDPAIVQVVDADPDLEGTQISLSGDFRRKQNFIAVNQVDQQSGLIDFAAVMIGEANVNGESLLAQIDWAPRQSGRTELTLEEVELASSDGKNIQAQSRNSSAENRQSCE